MKVLESVSRSVCELLVMFMLLDGFGGTVTVEDDGKHLGYLP